MSTTTDSSEKLGTFPYVIGGMSFIPLIGILFGFVAIVWGLVTKKQGGKRLAAIGAGGILEFAMKVYSAVIERCPQTGLFVGFVPGFPGAHSQGDTLDEVNHNLHDVITMLLEDGEPVLESEFVGVQNVAVA